MKVSEVSRLNNDALRCSLKELVAQDRATTVRLLIHVAEFDSRRLYRQDGYDSMFRYCVGDLGMSADVAYKRIRVAQKARRFPRIYVAIADGTLTMTAVSMLSRYLTGANADDLLSSAAGRTNDQVGSLIAERFPQPDLTTLLQPVVQASPPTAFTSTIESHSRNCQELAARPIADTMQVATPRPTVTPLSPDRFVLRVTVSESLKNKLQRVQDLLGHRAPRADEAAVIDLALDVLIEKLEKRKFGATDRPCKARRESHDPRHIPAHVKRAVSLRDGDRCTFMAEKGRRCEATGALEFDHVLPIGRGGTSTAENVRLRCRAHNQLAAEQTYGSEFVQAKREETREQAAKKRADEVIPWLRALGIRADHAREAAERCDRPGASLEERVKAALSCFAPRDVALRRATPV